MNLTYVFSWIKKASVCIKDDTIIKCWNAFYKIVEEELPMDITAERSYEAEKNEEFESVVENLVEEEVDDLEYVISTSYQPLDYNSVYYHINVIEGLLTNAKSETRLKFYDFKDKFIEERLSEIKK